MWAFFAELKRRNVHRTAIAYIASSWLLVEVCETLSDIYAFDAAVIRWLIVALVVGFVPVLGLSWALEWSASGLRSQADVDRDPAQQHSAGRKMDRVIIAVLSLALLLFAADKFLLSDLAVPPSAGVRSIAVLPFDDLTEAQDQAYFADGLAEELLNLLTKNPGLRVVARTSSFTFRDSSLTVDEIATQLGVDHVLEGSVRRDGNRIRVTAQLIAGADGYHVWSDTYDEPFTSIFAIQDRVAGQIASGLDAHSQHGAEEIRRTYPEAFSLFLKARYESRQGGREDLVQAAAYLHEVIAIDPVYAPAWALMAKVYSNLVAHDEPGREQYIRLARNAATRATDVDPDYWGGFAQLAWIAHRFDGDLGTAVRYIDRALEIESGNVDIVANAAVLLLQLGRVDDAIEALEFCRDRSPIFPTAYYNLGMAYKYADRMVEAERSFRKTVELSSTYLAASYQLGETLLIEDRPVEALEIWRAHEGISFDKGEVIALYALGRQNEADAALDNLITIHGEDWPSMIADIYAYRNERDRAFDWIEKDYVIYGSAGWGELKLNRFYDNLRDDPRWPALLQRIGVNEESLAGYQLDFTLPPTAAGLITH